MSASPTKIVHPPPPPVPNLIPYNPASEGLYKRRYKALKDLVQDLEDENNLVALKISQVKARIKAREQRIIPALPPSHTLHTTLHTVHGSPLPQPGVSAPAPAQPLPSPLRPYDPPLPPRHSEPTQEETLDAVFRAGRLSSTAGRNPQPLTSSTPIPIHSREHSRSSLMAHDPLQLTPVAAEGYRANNIFEPRYPDTVPPVSSEPSMLPGLLPPGYPSPVVPGRSRKRSEGNHRRGDSTATTRSNVSEDVIMVDR